MARPMRADYEGGRSPRPAAPGIAHALLGLHALLGFTNTKAPLRGFRLVPAAVSGWRCTSSPRSRNASRCIQAWSTCGCPFGIDCRPILVVRPTAAHREITRSGLMIFCSRAPAQRGASYHWATRRLRGAMNTPADAHGALYPEAAPFAVQQLAVGEGHALYVEQCGNPRGFPALFLHGGPGSRIRPRHGRYFDPAFYRVVLFDQRGCGQSTPSGSIADNTTRHLVADIDALRRHLGIERFLLFGGSWGSTLALAYAIAHPGRVAAMVLRGIFLGTWAEVAWYLDALRNFVPAAWEALAQGEATDLLGAYYRAVSEDNGPRALAAAQRWVDCEEALMNLESGSSPPSPVEGAAETLARARIQLHYLVHDCF